MQKLGYKRSMKQLSMLYDSGVEFYIGGEAAGIDEMASNILRETADYRTEFHFDERGSLSAVCLVERNYHSNGECADDVSFKMLTDTAAKTSRSRNIYDPSFAD